MSRDEDAQSAEHPAPWVTDTGRSPVMRVGWILLGLLLVVLAIGGGIILTGHKDKTVAGDPVAGAPIADAPRTPPAPGLPGPQPPVSFPEVPTPIPRELPTPGQPPPGGSESVAGSRNNRTVACNDSTVFVSGTDNTVRLTGHCTRVDVAGVQNTVTMDTADAIVVSGVRNTVVYLSGTPQLAKTGIDNTINGR